MNFLPFPGVPTELLGSPVVAIDGVALDTPARSGLDIAEELINPLRKYAAPLLDTWHVGPPTDVAATHGDPEFPGASRADHMLLTELGVEGQRTLISIAGQAKSDALLVIELRQLGGAFAKPNPSGGAVNAFSAAYSYYGLGIVQGTESGTLIDSQLANLRERLTPWATGFTAPSLVAGFDAPKKSFPDDIAARV